MIIHNSFLCTITYFSHCAQDQRTEIVLATTALVAVVALFLRWEICNFFYFSCDKSFTVPIFLVLIRLPFLGFLFCICLFNFVHLVCLRKKWVSCRCRSELHVCSELANSQLALLTIQPLDIIKLYFFVISMMILSVEDNDKLQRRQKLPLSRDQGLAPFLTLYLSKIMQLLHSVI